MIYETIIIGAGPAGYSTGIYTARAGLSTVIFGKSEESSLYKANIIGNYFGVDGNPSGALLLKKAEKQFTELKGKRIKNEIINISSHKNETFILNDNKRMEWIAKTVIIATGINYSLAGINGEKEFTGRGVSYCVTCDGFFFKNKSVAVIGASDYAAAEAIKLISYTKNVTILSHGKKPEFSSVFMKQLQKEGIKVIKTPKIQSFIGKDKLEKIIFSKKCDDGSEEMLVEGVFMAIGKAGANTFSKTLGLEMERNYIKINRDGSTNIKGIFAAGDCTGSPSQVAVSVGSGCVAALSAIKLLRGINFYTQYN